MRTAFLKTLLCALFILIFSANYSQTAAKTLTVYIFLSETCPICQSYTLPLKELYKKFNEKSVAFIGLFPNYYAEADSVAAFKKKYNIPFDLLIDKNAEKAKHFKASITPEVFVENSNREILYSGRIDDSFYAVGKRRKVVGSHDLDDALSAIISNKKITSHKTEAVGCIISLVK